MSKTEELSLCTKKCVLGSLYNYSQQWLEPEMCNSQEHTNKHKHTRVKDSFCHIFSYVEEGEKKSCKLSVLLSRAVNTHNSIHKRSSFSQCDNRPCHQPSQNGIFFFFTQTNCAHTYYRVSSRNKSFFHTWLSVDWTYLFLLNIVTQPQ